MAQLGESMPDRAAAEPFEPIPRAQVRLRQRASSVSPCDAVTHTEHGDTSRLQMDSSSFLIMAAIAEAATDESTTAARVVFRHLTTFSGSAGPTTTCAY